MNWTLAKAKDHLSEVVRRAVDDGPQTISVRGEDTAVIISKTDFEQLQAPGAPSTLKDLLGSMNWDGVDLERDETPARDVEL